jgi:hypothetical protein
VTDQETAELNGFVELEHILRLAKAKLKSSWEPVLEESAELRAAVVRRANSRSEYCLVHRDDAGVRSRSRSHQQQTARWRKR